MRNSIHNRLWSCAGCLLLVLIAFGSLSCSGPGKSNLGTGVYYEVKQGDTLTKIARLYHTSPKRLAEINRIKDPGQLQEGIVLFIPYSEQGLAKPAHPAPEESKGDKAPPAEAKGASSESGKKTAGKADAAPAGDSQGDNAALSEGDKTEHPPELRKTPVSQPLWKPPAAQKAGEAQISERAASPNAREAKEAPAATKSPAVPPPRREVLTPAEKGKFSWPVRGKVSDHFGRQPNGMYFNHIRIITKDGAPVVTAAPGMVIFSAPLKEFGETVIVKHDQRFATVYTHLGSRLVKVDHRVRKGEQIGLAGKSETRNEGYIHFEIRDHNKSRNPLLFLP